MGKQKNRKMNKKVLGCILAAAMMMAALTACSDTDTVNLESTSQSSESSSEVKTSEATTKEENTTASERGAEMEQDMVIGQISSIDDDSLTILLAEQPQLPEGEHQPPSGEIPEKPTDSKQPAPDSGSETGESQTLEAEGDMSQPERDNGFPEDGDGNRPSRESPDGTGPNGKQDRKQMEMQLTDETITVKITEETEITVNGEAASLQDLSVGDMVTLQKDGDTIVSIAAGAQSPPSASE